MKANFSYDLTNPVTSDDHSAGPEDAIITLVEYGDYECPYCGKAYPIVKQLQQDFKDDLRFVFRNFPLSQLHRYAFGAAESAEIASEYGKFWEMHDTLFENQRELDVPHLVSYAQNIGIDPEEFVAKLRANDKVDKVKADFMGGVESGVNGTPSFFINGLKYDGPWDYDSMVTVMNWILSQQ